MIENILIIDTETTGLEPSKGAKTIEVAAVLFNIKYKTILQSYTTLLPCDVNPAQDINQIDPEATKCNYSLIAMDDVLKGMVDKAEACVAHNKEFDMKFVALLTCGDHLLNKRWICTKREFKWPVLLPRKRLEDVCEAMQVPYVDAHRALQDCELLAKCFQKVNDLAERFDQC